MIDFIAIMMQSLGVPDTDISPYPPVAWNCVTQAACALVDSQPGRGAMDIVLPAGP